MPVLLFLGFLLLVADRLPSIGWGLLLVEIGWHVDLPLSLGQSLIDHAVIAYAIIIVAVAVRIAAIVVAYHLLHVIVWVYVIVCLIQIVVV